MEKDDYKKRLREYDDYDDQYFEDDAYDSDIDEDDFINEINDDESAALKEVEDLPTVDEESDSWSGDLVAGSDFSLS